MKYFTYISRKRIGVIFANDKEDQTMKLWYAVMMDNEDNDWGYGSADKAQALQMLETAREDHPDAYIAVIDDGDDPVCIEEIR